MDRMECVRSMRKNTNGEAYGELAFPPYGKMTETHRSALREFPLIPSDWRVPAGSTLPLEKHYEGVLDGSLAVIKEVLWPEYTPLGWEGASAANMAPLTALDLDIMLQMQTGRSIDEPVFTGASATHRELFENEDKTDDPFGARYDAYNPPGLNFALSKRASALGDKALARKVANGPLRLKLALQRPRPYQTALMFGRSAFIYLEANTACTPSIFSGHSLQGLLSIGGIIEAFLTSGDTVTPQLLKYAVDIGDRRVMAGVHYPSDNLASWIMAMQSAPFIFRTDGVKPLLWRAIQEHSNVYHRILGAGGVYQPALDALTRAANATSESRASGRPGFRQGRNNSPVTT
jgi:hypothetical protein